MQRFKRVLSYALLLSVLLVPASAALAVDFAEPSVCLRDDGLTCMVKAHTAVVQFPHLPLLLAFFGAMFLFLIIRTLIRLWDLVGI